MGLLACFVVYTFLTPCVLASPAAIRSSTQHILNDIKLDKQHHVEKIIVRSDRAYILTTSGRGRQTALWLYVAELQPKDQWTYVGGMADKPLTLFHSQANLDYSLSGGSTRVKCA